MKPVKIVVIDGQGGALGKSLVSALKNLIPVNRCGVLVAGTAGMPYAEYVKKAAELIKEESIAITRES